MQPIQETQSNSGVSVYIGLGSNLNSPTLQLDLALETLSRLPSSSLEKCSAYYSSKPVGPQDQPDFVNAVALLQTTLPPDVLLAELQSIEQNQGRIKKRHWGERTIDLDILLYADISIESKDLIIPHKELANRDFVLRPLLELNSELKLPDGTHLSSLLISCPNNQLHRISK